MIQSMNLKKLLESGELKKALENHTSIYLTDTEYRSYRPDYINRILWMNIVDQLIVVKGEGRDRFVCRSPKVALVFDKYGSEDQLAGAILRLIFRDYRDIKIHDLNNTERELISLKFHLGIEDINIRSSVLSILSFPWVRPDSNISTNIIDSLRYIFYRYGNELEYYEILNHLKIKHRVNTLCNIFYCEDEL